MKWRVKDFKGIADCELVLDAGITTILTGVNSSGKTSLIQSLLLIRQTRVADRGVVLNGPLVRLGNAEDLVRDDAHTKSISLLLQQDHDTYDVELVPATSRGKNWQDVAVEEDPLDTSLQVARLAIGTDESVRLAELTSRGIRTADIALIRRVFGALNEHSLLRIKPKSDAVSRGALPRAYVVFNGIRPIWLVQCFDPSKIRFEYKRKLMEAIEQYRAATGGQIEVRRNSVLVRTLRKLIASEVGNHLGSEHRTSSAGESHANRYLSPGVRVSLRSYDMEEESLQRLMAMTDKEVNDLVDSVADRRADNPTSVVDIRNNPFPREQGLIENDLWERASDLIRVLVRYSDAIRHLSARLNYLGPLRDEPRVVWGQWNAETPGLPVGIRGELAAAYLAKNKDRRVEYCTPIEHVQHASTLGEATDQWLDHLGIGTEVHAKNYGKIGVGLEVTWGRKSRDLTSVGVGVSQALPIVLAGLAVPRESIFIIEQPELHLHPDVQAKLADFFLFARPDIAFIVETHSEALITRVRRRIAEGICEPSNVQLIFVEPEGMGTGGTGASDEMHSGAKGRRIGMTGSGDFEEWPKGFISGSLEDSQAILEANIGRVRKAMENG